MSPFPGDAVSSDVRTFGRDGGHGARDVARAGPVAGPLKGLPSGWAGYPPCHGLGSRRDRWRCRRARRPNAHAGHVDLRDASAPGATAIYSSDGRRTTLVTLPVTLD